MKKGLFGKIFWVILAIALIFVGLSMSGTAFAWFGLQKTIGYIVTIVGVIALIFVFMKKKID